MAVGRHAGEGEQAETRQRGDDFAAFDKTGQIQPRRSKIRVDDADSGEREESDFHGKEARSAAIPPRVEPAGMKNRWRNGLRHAVRKHVSGMMIMPATSSDEAIERDVAAGTVAAVSANRMLIKPSPKHAM